MVFVFIRTTQNCIIILWTLFMNAWISDYRWECPFSCFHIGILWGFGMVTTSQCSDWSFDQPQVRNVLMGVYQDARSPVEKRVAAYLILMKNTDQALLRDIVNNLEDVSDEQLKSFVVSHLNNIRNSDKPQMLQWVTVSNKTTTYTPISKWQVYKLLLIDHRCVFVLSYLDEFSFLHLWWDYLTYRSTYRT